MSSWTNERNKTMKRLIPALVTFIIINCVSYSQIMINAQGEMHRCGAYGNGLVGIIQANKIQDDCVSSMRTAGYVEIEKAGAIGIYFKESDTLASILRVIPEAPAALLGFKTGTLFSLLTTQRSIQVVKQEYSYLDWQAHLLCLRLRDTMTHYR
jgi:hypothetical protein